MSADPLSVFIDREAFFQQVAQNSAKMAWHSAEVTSEGWGLTDVGEAILFDSLFIERPAISHGYSLDGDDLVDEEYPRAFGFVRDWKLDKNGYWRGAWVSLVVDGGDVSDGYSIIHSFTFSGMSIKPIREDLTAATDPVPNNQLIITPES